MENIKILQIIPAPADLRALFENEDRKTASIGRLAALALVEEPDGYRYVTGLCAGDDICAVDACESFLGFTFEEDE